MYRLIVYFILHFSLFFPETNCYLILDQIRENCQQRKKGIKQNINFTRKNQLIFVIFILTFLSNFRFLYKNRFELFQFIDMMLISNSRQEWKICVYKLLDTNNKRNNYFDVASEQHNSLIILAKLNWYIPKGKKQKLI